MTWQQELCSLGSFERNGEGGSEASETPPQRSEDGKMGCRGAEQGSACLGVEGAGG